MNVKKKNCFLLVVLSILLCLPFSLSLPAEAAYENTHVNTGDQATDLVEVARTQVGYHEGTNNYTKYNVWFGSLNGYGYNYAWCQTFVAWCANQAGIPTSMIPRVSGTISGMDFFKKNGTWKGAGITPEKGDIIYLYSKSSSGYHVGIVADVSGGQISTIEGNSSDRVAERSYSVVNSSIVGYGCPEYVEPNPNPPSISELSIEKTNYAVGESVNFHFSSDYATKYTLGIDKGSEKRLDTIYDITNTGYSYTFQEPGEYRAYVVSINEYGYKDSNWITFYVYDKSPSISELSIEKTNYAVGESVNFHFSSDYATKYTLGIDKGSEKRLDTIYDITNTGYSYTFQEPGEYRAYVVSINEYGYKDSNWIAFYVYNKISITDIISLQQSLLRQTTLTADQALLADYNGDSSINVLDLMLLKRALLAL